MNLQEAEQLQATYNAHVARLGCAELSRRFDLARQANQLYATLIERLYLRSVRGGRVELAKIVKRALARLERREASYYGG